MTEQIITLPHIYEERDYQSDFWDAFHGTGRHRGKEYDIFILNWHRRAGKDMTCWNAAIERTAEEPMTCKYGFPTGDMARDNLWESYTNDGLRFTEFIPLELRVRKNKGDDGLNDSLKRIEFITGGSIRVISVHNPDRARGGNSKLFVLSELQAMDPRIIDIIEPILEANHGKLIVNLTSNGDSAAKGLLDGWLEDPRAYVSILTVRDTPVFTDEQMMRIRQRTRIRYQARGLSIEEADAFVDQEYYCNWDSPVIGSYFGAAMRLAKDQGRITRVPHDPMLPVETWWDLGVDDSMTIWFVQLHNQEIRLIDYYESSGEGFSHYNKVLRGQFEGFERMKEYTYSTHKMPHDIKVRNMGEKAESRYDICKKLGIWPITVVERPSKKEHGIEASRTIIARCWFDAENTKRGVNALKGYKKAWNDKMQVYGDNPVHDWTSHGSDGFQTGALTKPGTFKGSGGSVKRINRPNIARPGVMTDQPTAVPLEGTTTQMAMPVSFRRQYARDPRHRGR